MDLTIKVIKNVLNDSIHRNILSTVEAHEVSWHKSEVLRNSKDYQFSHTIYEDHNVTSNLFDVFKPLFTKLEIKLFHRVRLNCNIKKNDNRILGGFHIDYGDINTLIPENLMIGIYYLNSTNGKTLIKENGKIREIKCIANSVVLFSGNLEHSGTTHTDKDFRYVLNLNYI